MGTDNDELTPGAEKKVRARRLARTLESFNPENLSKKLAQADAASPAETDIDSAEPVASSSSHIEPIAKTLLEHEMSIDLSQSLSSKLPAEPLPLQERQPEQPPEKSAALSKSNIPEHPAPKKEAQSTVKSISLLARTLLLSPVPKKKIEKSDTPVQPAPKKTAQAPGNSISLLAKTLLLSPVPKKKNTPEQSAPKKTASRSIKQVAKTLLGSDITPPAKKSSPVRNPDSGRMSAIRPSKQFVAKTLLDRNMIIEASARFSARKIERLEKEVSERLLQPQKHITPVTAQKRVGACPFSWNDEGNTDRLKMCTMCQSNIYDFEDIDEAEANAMIFKRENRESFVLYQRADGKFMTSACPIVSKRNRQKVILAAAALLIVVLIGTCITLMPPQPESDSYYRTQNTEPYTGHSSKSSDSGDLTKQYSSPSSSATSKDRHHVWETKRIVIGESTAAPSQPQEPPFSDAEEKGEFWRF